MEREPFADSPVFTFDRPHRGLLRLWLDTGLPQNAVTHDNHSELGRVWGAVADDEARVVLVRGVNGAFCGGGTAAFLGPLVDDHRARMQVLDDMRALIRGVTECPKPVVSAIDGYCAGAGLALGVMADVSLVARSATLHDAHTIAGLVCGDHAAFAWPLLMGMAKAKYHLLTATPLDGEEAERLGLVSLVVDDDRLHDRALNLARDMAGMDGEALSLNKRALNGWWRLAGPVMEEAAVLEAMSFAGEGARALVRGWESRPR